VSCLDKRQSDRRLHFFAAFAPLRENPSPPFAPFSVGNVEGENNLKPDCIGVSYRTSRWMINTCWWRRGRRSRKSLGTIPALVNSTCLFFVVKFCVLPVFPSAPCALYFCLTPFNHQTSKPANPQRLRGVTASDIPPCCSSAIFRLLRASSRFGWSRRASS